jgi:polar amino acid transport system permease protein
MVSEAAVLRERRLPPRDRRTQLRAALRSSWQVAQAVIVLGLIGWLIIHGAMAMHYHWQWYRVPPYLYKIVDGEFILGSLTRGLIETLEITAISLALALAIGLVTAFLRLSRSIAGRLIATVYLEIIRNTPLLVQIFLVYFVLAPIFGVGRFWAAVLTLAFYEGSFASEIIRGGIVAVERGQYEAADAIGLTVRDKYRYVIIPQSLPLMIPPLTGLVISLVKSSAIVSVIAVSELTTEGLNAIADTFMAFEIWLTVAAMYLVVTVALSIGVGLLEKRLKRHRV